MLDLVHTHARSGTCMLDLVDKLIPIVCSTNILLITEEQNRYNNTQEQTTTP